MYALCSHILQLCTKHHIGLIKTWALHQVSAESDMLIGMGTYARLQNEYFSHRIFFSLSWLSQEQVGYGVISGSAMAFNNTHHTALARLLWNIDCFQENSSSDISPISKEQHRTLLPKGREKYTESISTLTSTAECNCCYIAPPPFTEHCVQDMNERSISYYSAHLSVCNTLPANQTEWLHGDNDAP